MMQSKITLRKLLENERPLIKRGMSICQFADILFLEPTNLVCIETSKIGRLAEIKLLDSRQFRSIREICDQNLQSSLGFETSGTNAMNFLEKNRTMLGRAQTDWLVDNLKSNLASWNVIASTRTILTIPP